MEIFRKIQNESFVDVEGIEKANTTRFLCNYLNWTNFVIVVQQNARWQGLPASSMSYIACSFQLSRVKDWQKLGSGNKQTIRIKPDLQWILCEF